MSKKFAIQLDSFTDEIFYKLERIADMSGNHQAEFNAETKGEAAKVVAERLLPFIETQLSEVFPDDSDQ